jgi:hypothetical protein
MLGPKGNVIRACKSHYGIQEEFAEQLADMIVKS